MEIDRRDFLKGTVAAGVAMAVGGKPFNSEVFANDASKKTTKEVAMKPLTFFMDTHDKNDETFPAKISPAEFEKFYSK